MDLHLPPATLTYVWNVLKSIVISKVNSKINQKEKVFNLSKQEVVKRRVQSVITLNISLKGIQMHLNGE